MLLNRLEYALMNNPVRASLQRWVEAPRLLRLGGGLRGGRVLEIGCGRGVGVGVILDVFGAERVDAFDLDPSMVGKAGRRLARRGRRVALWTGDATALPVRDSSYDAVFDFGILHHVPSWRAAVAEVGRVLKPGGRFYAEEVLRAAILHPFARRLFAHPLNDRFDRDEFVEALQSDFADIRTEGVGDWFGWFVAERRPGA